MARYLLSFSGGSFKNSTHINEKFLALGCVGQEEMFLSQLERNGLIQQRAGGWSDDLLGEDRGLTTFQSVYETDIKLWKVFMSLTGHGLRRQVFSIFFELFPSNAIKPVVRLLPIGASMQGDRDFQHFKGSHFKAKCRILSRDESLEICSSETADYIKKMPPISIPLLKQLIYVDRSNIRKNVRNIRLKKKKYRQ